jgi:hypothetical protein
MAAIRSLLFVCSSGFAASGNMGPCATNRKTHLSGSMSLIFKLRLSNADNPEGITWQCQWNAKHTNFAGKHVSAADTGKISPGV